MVQQVKVQPGDTVSSIAKRFGVAPSQVQGFRSNDPNVIFPDEILTIQDGQPAETAQNEPVSPDIPQSGTLTPDGQALQPTPQTPPPVEQTQQITPAQPPEQPNDQVVEEALQQSQPQQPTVQPSTPQQPTVQPVDTSEFFTTPSGAQVTEEGELATPPPEAQALQQFGIDPQAAAQGFQTNPFGTLSEIVQQVMQATGLPDVRDTITKTANQIEELENERDREIAKVQDNPFFSAGRKAREAQQISDKYDQRINARVNKLTLLQSAQQDARQQAQFAATTAINLFGQQQRFQFDQIESMLDREEKQLEAQRKEEERLFGRKLDLAELSLAERRVAVAEAAEARQREDDRGGSQVTRIDEEGNLILGTPPPKPPTEGERQSLAFFQRMEDAVGVLNELDGDVSELGLGGQIGLKLPSLVQSEVLQTYSQAQRQFTEARLRKDSGAAIPPSEFRNDQLTYFPQPGDDPGTLARKKAAREVTLGALRAASGNAYWDFYGRSPIEESVQQQINRQDSPENNTGPQVREASNEELEASL